MTSIETTRRPTTPSSAAPRCSAWIAVLLLAAALPAAAADTGGPRIVNGINSHDFPTTGALMYNLSGGAINENNANSWCTGTLIGCETFLTAAHCVEDDQTAANYWVFLQHAGVRTVTSVTSHPSYTSGGFPEFDIAVLKLGAPVNGIAPTAINESSSPPAGTAGQIVGFGQTDGSAGDYGIKRAGDVITADCAGVIGGLGNTELVCWQFTNPVGPPGDDSNTCNGDSGGPLFVDLGSGEVVAGVTSGGNNGTCLATDDSYDSNVFTYRSFVNGELGSDSTSSCGGLPPVGDPTVTVIGFDGNLSGGNADDSLSVNVTGTPSELRITLKGEDNGSLNVDFFVKEGTGAGPGDFDCNSDGSANVGECIFASPSAGEWSVFVERAGGSGEYQVTASIFGGDPPVCGNDIIEPGEECDGTDPGSCPTSACDLDCTCPDPVCGNDIVETGEQCDGTDDSACPGQCDGSCTCPATCNTGDLFVTRMKSDVKRFHVKMELNNFGGTYDGLDPRNQFLMPVTQGGGAVLVDIPALDVGWAKSKPVKGRYKWKGVANGISRVKATDRSATRGTWKIQVKGKDVPGAGGIDLADPTLINVQLNMDGVCTETDY